ncbi:proteasome regulatory particle base subunit [Mycoemilia scoparia]|uniref:26S proteasome regulatory subunit RPN1 n=1 Tax=Mycoemilia scoparia TaxID=417184 RepID=A0A9W8DNE9_9FUNG|nr:proteasome regulatory particle base subunit [Mycoemilia scoparia]
MADKAPSETKGKVDSNAKNDTLDNKKKKEEIDLTEDDIKVIQDLERIVGSITKEVESGNSDLPSLKELKKILLISESSMAEVTKYLKFLKPHYDTLSRLLKTTSNDSNRYALADILSFIGMIYGRDKSDALSYRLLANEKLGGKTQAIIDSIGEYGHEYARHLCVEIKKSHTENLEKEDDAEYMVVEDSIDNTKLIDLAKVIAQFFFQKGPELDAIDLLMDVECINDIPNYITTDIYERVCKYMLSCSQAVSLEDSRELLEATYDIYTKFGSSIERIPISLKLNDHDKIVKDFNDCKNDTERKQVAFLLCRQRFDISQIETDNEVVNDCLRGANISSYFLEVAKHLQILEPKKPSDIYKSNNDPVIPVSSSKDHLSNVFVSAFVNAGFKEDALGLTKDKVKNQSWLAAKGKNTISSTASLGMVLMWSNPEISADILGELLSSEHKNIRAGAALALGISNAGTLHEADLTKALLSDIVEDPSIGDSSDTQAKQTSILSLGIAYAKTNDEEVTNYLLPFLKTAKKSIKTTAFTSLALGFVHLGSGNAEIISTLLDLLSDLRAEDASQTLVRFTVLGLALVVLGRRDVIIYDSKSNNEDDKVADSEGLYVNISNIKEPLKGQVKVLVMACSLAGSGEVLAIQKLLRYINYSESVSENKEPTEAEKDNAAKPSTAAAGTSGEASAAAATGGAPLPGSTSGTKDRSKHQTSQGDLSQCFAVLGVALVSLGEDIGTQMVLRMFDHIMQYGNPLVRRTVPLAIGLVCTSNPKPAVIDVLSKYSHDSDINIAMSAIFAMGLIGAGTNHARLAQLIRQLFSYHHNSKAALFTARIALGMLHMGKGTITINPLHHERFLLSQTAIAGLLVSVLTYTNINDIIFSDADYLLYFMSLAMWPRYLVTVKEDKENNGELVLQRVDVQVGEAVDVVGKAGKHKTIKGFQSHQTPVILAQAERAEIATDEYIPCTKVLEGPVIVYKNPEHSKK